MNRRKVLVTDLDGTLFQSGTMEFKSTENQKAIQEWIDAGNVLWAATGRGADAYLKLHDMNIPVEALICSGGAGYVIHDEEPVYSYEITESLAEEVFGYMKDNFPDVDYCLDVAPADCRYGYTCGLYMKEHFPEDPNMKDEYAWMDGHHHLLRLFCMSHSDKYVNHVAEVITEQFPGKLHGLHTDRKCIDIMHARSNKGNQLAHVMELMGVGKEDVYAIGDETTDIYLLNHSGTGFAMKDGAEQLKECADYTVGSVAEAVRMILDSKA